MNDGRHLGLRSRGTFSRFVRQSESITERDAEYASAFEFPPRRRAQARLTAILLVGALLLVALVAFLA